MLNALAFISFLLALSVIALIISELWDKYGYKFRKPGGLASGPINRLESLTPPDDLFFGTDRGFQAWLPKPAKKPKRRKKLKKTTKTKKR